MLKADDMQIRLACPADEAMVTDLWLRLQREHEALEPRFRLADDASRRFANDFQAWIGSDWHRIFVADVDQACVGFITAHPWHPAPIYTPSFGIYINDLFVLPDFRRKGMATKLVAEVQAWAAEIKATHVRLGLVAQNPMAQQFWTHIGADAFSVVFTLPVESAG